MGRPPRGILKALSKYTFEDPAGVRWRYFKGVPVTEAWLRWKLAADARALDAHLWELWRMEQDLRETAPTTSLELELGNGHKIV